MSGRTNFRQGPGRVFLSLPLNFDRVMVRDMTMIQAAGAFADTPIFVQRKFAVGLIFISPSPKISRRPTWSDPGTFMTKVFEGPYRIPRWIKEIKRFVRTKGRQVKKLYMFYTTCPKSRISTGKIISVLVAEV